MKLYKRFCTAPLSNLLGVWAGICSGTLGGILGIHIPSAKPLLTIPWLVVHALTLFPLKRPDRLEIPPDEVERGWRPGVFDGFVFGVWLLIFSATAYTIVVVMGP